MAATARRRPAGAHVAIRVPRLRARPEAATAHRVLAARCSPAASRRRSYVLASLGQDGELPLHLWGFLGAILGLSLARAPRQPLARAQRQRRCCCPIATLLNGIGYVEIARWNPPYGPGQQALWAAISAGALRRDALRSCGARATSTATATCCCSLAIVLLLVAAHPAHRAQDQRRAPVGPRRQRPVPARRDRQAPARHLLRVVLRRRPRSCSRSRRGGSATTSSSTRGRSSRSWSRGCFAMVVLGLENDIGFAMLLFTLFIALLWMTHGPGRLPRRRARALRRRRVRRRRTRSPRSTSASRCGSTRGRRAKGNGCQLIQRLVRARRRAASAAPGSGSASRRLATCPTSPIDMIFAAIGEEMGLLGIAAVVLRLHACSSAPGLQIAQRARSDFARLVRGRAHGRSSASRPSSSWRACCGCCRSPGITLPFMAYGGSSLVANYVLIALLMRLSEEAESRPTAAEAPMAVLAAAASSRGGSAQCSSSARSHRIGARHRHGAARRDPVGRAAVEHLVAARAHEVELGEERAPALAGEPHGDDVAARGGEHRDEQVVGGRPRRPARARGRGRSTAPRAARSGSRCRGTASSTSRRCTIGLGLGSSKLTFTTSTTTNVGAAPRRRGPRLARRRSVDCPSSASPRGDVRRPRRRARAARRCRARRRRRRSSSAPAVVAHVASARFGGWSPTARCRRRGRSTPRRSPRSS